MHLSYWIPDKTIRQLTDVFITPEKPDLQPE